MNNHGALKKAVLLPLAKTISAVAAIVGSVLLCEQLRNYLTAQTQLDGDYRDVLIAILESSLALMAYVLVFKFFEKRTIKELGLGAFGKYAVAGFLTGFLLQSLSILVLYAAGGYSIVQVNPLSFVVPGFSAALVAGFVAELIIRGIIFRLVEEQTGTVMAVSLTAFLFVVLHMGGKDATILSVAATVMQAGILASAGYVLTRSLWFPIFFHFAWDFAEPGIYGGINPGINIAKSWVTSWVTGPWVLTGGKAGPGNSLQALIFCLVTAAIFLRLAKRQNNFIRPSWKKVY
jgi:hypothetical protein